MGGRGSGRQFWLRRKTTVERCWCISIADFTKIIKEGVSGNINWKNEHKEVDESSISFVLLPETDSEAMLILSYTINDSDVDEPILFQKTYPHFGGVRWWFTCPVCKNRVGRLYLPIKSNLFACRKCHNLTYRSSQNSKKYNMLYAMIADSAGTTAEMVKKILDSSVIK